MNISSEDLGEQRPVRGLIGDLYATVQCLTETVVSQGARITALETSCNASHAPSDYLLGQMSRSGSSQSSTPSSAESSVACTSADPSAAVRDDPKVRILPPLEIADHADALGWTPESRVWKANVCPHYWVFPSAKFMAEGLLGVEKAALSEEYCKRYPDTYTILPNRRVQSDRISEAAFVAASVPDLEAAWVKAAGERAAAPRPAKSAGEVAEEVVKNWAGPDAETRNVKLVNLITAAIERERERKA